MKMLLPILALVSALGCGGRDPAPPEPVEQQVPLIVPSETAPPTSAAPAPPADAPPPPMEPPAPREAPSTPQPPAQPTT
ncbi:MAG: hypothetical protein KDA24_06525, partial [Deltaproteobacteria bacterium]|nr:hypothetical protein [Deltaproteobacteria bacterium]